MNQVQPNLVKRKLRASAKAKHQRQQLLAQRNERVIHERARLNFS